MIIAVLGRQNKIGLAELESVVGVEQITPLGDSAALVDGTLDADKLGSVLRLAQPIAKLPTKNWDKISAYINNTVPQIITDLPDSKTNLGLSFFGSKLNTQKLFALGLNIKKVCRASKKAVRIVPNSAQELNSAQIIHNKLTSATNLEILIITFDNSTWIAKTTWVQNIDAYAQRDFERPKRDAFVGMLPPKLAQIMLNLSGALPNETILDPFCGTGVILQEAALQGCKIYGTDLNPKMIQYTKENLKWLRERHGTPLPVLETADATTAVWQKPIDHVVSEVYLGQPLSGLPSQQKLQEIMHTCNAISENFLKNLHAQLNKGTKICIAVPAWFDGHNFKHLKLLDHLEDLGYNCIRFKFANQQDLIYYRQDQIVARQLLVLLAK